MSVFIKVFLLTALLPCLITSAPNQKSNEDHAPIKASLRRRQNGLHIPNLYPNSAAFPSSWPPASNGFPSGTSPLPVGTGNPNTASSSHNSVYQPFPTEGASYLNNTSGSGRSAAPSFVAAPTSQPAAALSIENAATQAGQSFLSAQCPPPQTVTLPPQTITLPAETVIVTAAPLTITITPQIQTQTITVTETITAGPAPACPSNAGSRQIPSAAAAPSNIPPIAGSIAAAASSVPTIAAGSTMGNQNTQPITDQTLGNQLPAAQTSAQVTASPIFMPSGQIPGAAASAAVPTNIVAPSAAPAMPSIAASPSSLPPISNLSPPNSGSESGPAPFSQAPAQPSAVPNPPPSVNTPLSPATSVNGFGQSSIAPFLPPPPTAPYQNTTGSFNATGPRGSAGIGPTASGFSGPASGPLNATSGAVLSGLAGPTGQIILPTAFYGTLPRVSSASGTDFGPNTPLMSGIQPLPAAPTLQPTLPVNDSDVQGPELSPFSTSSECTINGTSAQNITANYRDLKPSSLNAPLLYLGLNYTSFTLAASQPSHVMTTPTSVPKAIAVAPPFLSFGINSISLSCGDHAPPGNCSVSIAGLGTPSAASGQATTATERLVEIQGPGMQTFWFDETWVELSHISFTAQSGGKQMGVGVGELCYEIVSSC